jgi:hypothetical protein
VSIMDIYAWTVLSTDPTSTVQPKVGCCNSDSITFRGVTYGAGQVLLAGQHCDAIEVSSGVVMFRVYYHCVTCPETWAIELRPAISGGVWAAGSIIAPNGTNNDMRTTALSGSNLPVHTPVTP